MRRARWEVFFLLLPLCGCIVVTPVPVAYPAEEFVGVPPVPVYGRVVCGGPGAGALAGAWQGMLGGALIGSLAGEAGRGAAIGLGIGAIAGAVAGSEGCG